jgi:murein DD-endopeptidase MepM/ murein hydrolase activator NlpD
MAVLAVVAVAGTATLPAVAADLRPEVQQLRAGLDAAHARAAQAEADLTAAHARLAGLEGEHAAAEVARDVAAAALLEATAARQLAEQRAEEAAEEAADRAAALERQVQRVLAVAERRDRHSSDMRVLAVEAWKNGGGAARAAGVVDALLTAETMGDYLGAVGRLEIGADRTQVLVRETSEVLARDMDDRNAAAGRSAAAREVARRTAEVVVERLAEEQAHQERAAEAETVVAGLEVELAVAAEELEATAGELAAALAEADAIRLSAASLRHLGGAPGPGRLSWPTDGRPTSGFGSRMHPIHQEVRHHAGIDIPGPTGQPILAAAAGTVRVAGTRGGYGLTVEVDHGDGLSTLYAHLSRIDVRVGQRVGEAERLGALGSTGQSTGPHLHFEVRERGVARDPLGHYAR